MTANECACRQAERDNLVAELAAALRKVRGTVWIYGTTAEMLALEAVLARAKEQQQ